MNDFIGKEGKIQWIGPNTCRVHGWYWPFSALTPVEETEVSKPDPAATVPIEDFLRVVQALQQWQTFDASNDNFRNAVRFGYDGAKALESVKHIIPTN